jgi:regulator of extracellular matrix RemA (YlzA/DUF370 family)
MNDDEKERAARLAKLKKKVIEGKDEKAKAWEKLDDETYHARKPKSKKKSKKKNILTNAREKVDKEEKLLMKRYGIKKRHILLVILALIVLPTGTPEDLITSVPLIAFLGVTGYAVLCAAIVIALVVTGAVKIHRIWKEAKRNGKKIKGYLR